MHSFTENIITESEMRGDGQRKNRETLVLNRTNTIHYNYIPSRSSTALYTQ